MCDAGAHCPLWAPTSLGSAAQDWPLCGAQSSSQTPKQSPFLLCSYTKLIHRVLFRELGD